MISRRRELKMSAADFLPERRSIAALRKAAKDCRGCPLFQNATQTVFGEGAVPARVLLAGEQPGDQEDLQGRPFVGPAGKLLDIALAEAGIDREDVYITNAVKHFKWTPRGKKRLHAKPSSREVAACRPWLAAEIEAVEADIVVCLGATAAQSLLGSAFRITKQRGRWLSSDWAPALLATYHPSAILRAPEAKQREELRSLFVQDLKLVAKALAKELRRRPR
jgi:uracil-DNA glycosylase family protein